MTKIKHGLVIGKFYPPHAGHHDVIECAKNECDEVTVLVLWSKQESINADRRVLWLSHVHRATKPCPLILAVQDEYEVDYSSDKAWANHVGLMKRALGDIGPKVTHVYGSESYIWRLADELDASPRLVDTGRKQFPISGTLLRNNPQSNWHYLAPITKASLCKRIVCIGAESCGTTTLARDLADAFDTSWVPEYGRTFSEGMRKQDWTATDLRHIATAQRDLEHQMGYHSQHGLLICDTNTLATRVWSEFLVGKDVVHIAARKPDLYLLTDLCPWEDDGNRYGEDTREDMQRRFQVLLDQQDIPWHKITGNPHDRTKQGIILIQKIMHWDFNDPLPEHHETETN